MILLTGATGLIGRAILSALRAAGHPVAAMIRNPAHQELVSRLGAEPVLGRVEDPESWRGIQCDGIVHAAAMIRSAEGWARYERVNVTGTRLAAKHAAALGIRLVHISSVAVYGRREEDRSGVDEGYPFRPLSTHEYYARSKRAAEMEIRELERGRLDAVILRPCVVTGPGDRLFLPAVVRLVRRRLVPLFGSGMIPLPLVMAANVAEAARLALERPAAKGQAYNVTNDGSTTAPGLVTMVAEALDVPVQVIRVPTGPALATARLADLLARPFRALGSPASFASAVRFWRGGNPYRSAKIERELGWMPVVTHRAAIGEALSSGGGVR